MTECEDRFGTLPCEVKNLAELVRIRRWLLSFGALSLTVCEDFTEIRLSKHVLQPEVDYETSDLLIKRILDVCNRKAKGMRLSPDGRILLALRKKDFQKKETLQEAISELKRVLSLLAGEVYESHVTEFVSF
jgi:transcription-repair coupling factor (superfamily II helicase)